MWITNSLVALQIHRFSIHLVAMVSILYCNCIEVFHMIITVSCQMHLDIVIAWHTAISIVHGSEPANVSQGLYNYANGVIA